MTGIFERATPESQGVSSRAILAFLDAVNMRRIPLHSLMVVRHGVVIAEGWWAPYTPDDRQMMFSVSKTFTASAVAIAQGEGRLSIDEEVLDFFPQHASAAVRRQMAGMKVRDLLAMASGHGEDTFPVMRMLPDEDWTALFCKIPLAYQPGTHFCYNNGASFMLSAIVQARTGQSVVDYLGPRLFEPLGIADPAWDLTPRGLTLGLSGLRLRTEELAAMGWLYCNDGVWQGRRILPEGWVAQASSIHVANGEDPTDDSQQGYGFQMWRGRYDTYRLDGAFEQLSVIFPDKDMVVTVTAAAPNDGHPTLRALWDTIRTGAYPDPLLENRDGQAELTAALEALEVALPQFTDPAEDAPPALLGRDFALPPNLLGLASVRLDAADGAGEVVLTTRGLDGAVEQIGARSGQWVAGLTRRWPHDSADQTIELASQAGWVGRREFVVASQLIDLPFTRTWRFALTDDGVDVTAELDQPFWSEAIELRARGL